MSFSPAETCAPATDIEEMIKQLDIKYTRWELYRAYDKTWRLVSGEGRAKITWEGDTIADAMQKALDYISLPLVPRCPEIAHPTYFSAKKTGNCWALEYQGRGVQYNIKTRKKAMELASLITENSKIKHREWENEFGWVKEKTQGVDFEYLNP